MSERFKGTKDLFQAKVGDVLAPVEFTITEEMVERNAWGNDDYNPWYMEDSPFGGRIVSPTYLTLFDSHSFYGYYAYPPGGSLHAKEEFEYIRPLKVGVKAKLTGKLVERYARKGRDFFVAEFMVTDEEGNELIRMRRTQAAPVTPRPE
jgi:hypothetical protein